jgi:thiol-disulfide isomerase/thioredoxin
VVFWSGVCTHCVRYDPYFNQFETAHPELALYVVATRFTESVDDVRRAIAERGLRFPLYNGADGTAAAAYLAQQTPRVYLVDPARTLMYRGAVDNFKYAADPEYQPYLERAIESFLAGQAIERPETGSFGCAVKSVYYQLPKMIERPPARG